MTTDPAQMPELPEAVYMTLNTDGELFNYGWNSDLVITHKYVRDDIHQDLIAENDEYERLLKKYMARADLVAKPDWMALLDALKPITDYMEKLVDGWHHSPEFARHPDRLGVTIKTNCGTVYEIVDALRALQKGKGTT